MKNQILIKRYGQGLINSIKNRGEFDSLFGQLCRFAELIRSQKELEDALLNPFLPASKKTGIVQDILTGSGLDERLARFILLLVENDRLDLLPELNEKLPELWNEASGIQTFEVSSVVSLTGEQKKKLQSTLESLEGKPVSLKFKKEPELLGGLAVRKGNIIYDVSVQGNLKELEEKISEG